MTKNRIETAYRIFLIMAGLVMAFLLVMPSPALAGKIYFVTSGSIQKANLDGTMIENVVTSLNSPRNIALDLVNGRVYWTARDASNHGIIQRADLDGSNIYDLLTETPWINAIALDISNQIIYWNHSGDDNIQKTNFDGSGISIWANWASVGIAIYTSGAKIYGTDNQAPCIWSSDISPVSFQSLVLGPGPVTQPVNIAIDSVNGKMYWTEWEFGFELGPPEIPGHAAIVRADLDGSDVEEVFASGLNSPWGIGLDVAGEKVYWTDSSTGKVQRANMDGSGVEDLITGLSNPYGIALDLTNEHKALPCIPLLLLND